MKKLAISDNWMRANALAAAAVLSMFPASAFAQSSAFTQPLCKVLLTISGRTPLVAFVAGIAILIFFVMFALNEGNQMVSWGLKILIGVAGLIGLGAVMNELFGLPISC